MRWPRCSQRTSASLDRCRASADSACTPVRFNETRRFGHAGRPRGRPRLSGGNQSDRRPLRAGLSRKLIRRPRREPAGWEGNGSPVFDRTGIGGCRHGCRQEDGHVLRPVPGATAHTSQRGSSGSLRQLVEALLSVGRADWAGGVRAVVGDLSETKSPHERIRSEVCLLLVRYEQYAQDDALVDAIRHPTRE